MEVDERPTEQYSDIGGLDQQIQEVSLVISRFHKLISIRMITSNYGNQREREKKKKFDRPRELPA